jgi:hypothetical protein
MAIFCFKPTQVTETLVPIMVFLIVLYILIHSLCYCTGSIYVVYRCCTHLSICLLSVKGTTKNLSPT